ncbi:MAG: hypothetical protein ACRDPL_13405 [Propionibacteriaceae bacterium]
MLKRCLLAGRIHQLAGGGLGAIGAQGRGSAEDARSLTGGRAGRLNGGSMILSSACVWIICASRSGTTATKGLLVKTNGTSSWLFGAKLDLGPDVEPLEGAVGEPGLASHAVVKVWEGFEISDRQIKLQGSVVAPLDQTWRRVEDYRIRASHGWNARHEIVTATPEADPARHPPPFGYAGLGG